MHGEKSLPQGSHPEKASRRSGRDMPSLQHQHSPYTFFHGSRGPRKLALRLQMGGTRPTVPPNVPTAAALTWLWGGHT